MGKIEQIVEELINVATKSTSSQRHAACIVKRNKVLSVGYNYYLKNNHGKKYMIHAEVSAIQNLPKIYRNQTDKFDLIVIRVNNDASSTKYSKPCSSCSEYIKKFKIKNVYYT